MTDHLDDQLSAYLDGVLTPDERAAADEHLASCARCRLDLASLRHVRAMVHGLASPVEPPRGFLDALLHLPLPAARRRRLLRLGALNLLAVVACWVLVVTVLRVDSRRVSPAPATFTSAHASLVPSVLDTPAVDRSMAGSYKVPEELAGSYELVGFRLLDSGPQAVYANGDRAVSVFAVSGRLDTSDLPDSATSVRVDGAPAWRVRGESGDVVYVQRPGEVVVLVGAALEDLLPAVADGMDPDVAAHPGLVDHLEAAGEGLLDTFGLRG